MSKYIAEPLRIAVAKRADFRCEYCRRPEADSFIKYQIDHIIAANIAVKRYLITLPFPPHL